MPERPVLIGLTSRIHGEPGRPGPGGPGRGSSPGEPRLECGESYRIETPLPFTSHQRTVAGKKTFYPLGNTPGPLPPRLVKQEGRDRALRGHQVLVPGSPLNTALLSSDIYFTYCRYHWYHSGSVVSIRATNGDNPGDSHGNGPETVTGETRQNTAPDPRHASPPEPLRIHARIAHNNDL